MNTQKITISLPNSIMQNLKDFSDEFGKTKSGLIEEALSLYFDYKDLEIAQKRVDESSIKLSLDEMRKWSNELDN